MNKKIILPLLAIPLVFIAGKWLFAAATFVPNSQPVGYVSQPAITNFDISSGNEDVFRTDYNKNDWSGNLLSVPIAANGQADNANANWEAKVRLALQNYDTGRKIFTMNAATGVPFRWATTPSSTTMSSAQQTSISSSTVEGPKIVNFIRGDRSNETPNGSDFDARGSVLGAIIHSTPRYFNDGTDQVVYVGSNDGMLHAFSASTGDELWAYIPSMVISNLNKLTADPYTPMQHFVDGSPVVGKATISSVNKNILVGGLGAGGKGLYALNITDQTPASETVAATMPLWEITPTTINGSASSSYANLGYTYSTPVIGKVNSGSGQDAVIVGNGYMNTNNGKASLFVINAATGALIAEVATTSTDTGSTAAPNGLSSVRVVDTNGDGKIDLAYAGDLNGTMWKFNLSSTSSGSWSATPIISGLQAITSRPAVIAHPAGGYMVMFGTGRMLTAADATDTSTFYAYGVWDQATGSAMLSQTLTQATYYDNATTLTNAKLVRWATNNQPCYVATTPASSTCGSTAYPTAASYHKYWRTALPKAGERVLGDGAFTEGGRFAFTSTNPTTVNASPPDQEVWLNQLDYLTGGSAPSPFFNLNSDQVVDSADRIKSTGTTPILTNQGVPVSKFLRTGISSQPILVREAVLDDTVFTFNPDSTFPPPVVDLGVSGGHFDVDIFYGSGHNMVYDNTGGNLEGSWTDHIPDAVRHYHQYDDRYDVTGVNFLNASSTRLNLVNAIASTSTQFKVLVYNQYYSPAASISVGGVAAVPVKDYGGLTSATTPAVSSLPTYTRANILSLQIELPLTAFASKNWVGDGDVRTGLLPTAYDCVTGDVRGGSSLWPKLRGALHNGALSIQIIKSTTPQSSLVLNVAGHPEMGYRVKDSDRSTYILAEYSIYWHMPNSGFAVNGDTKICTQDSTWSDTPPQESASNSGSATPAAGSADPKGGSFTVGQSVISQTTTTVGSVTTETTTYSDGEIRTVVTTDNNDGTITIVTTNTSAGGVVLSTSTVTIATPGSSTGEGGEQVSSPYGRISWKDL